jgi:hypothetical protein
MFLRCSEVELRLAIGSPSFTLCDRTPTRLQPSTILVY